MDIRTPSVCINETAIDCSLNGNGWMTTSFTKDDLGRGFLGVLRKAASIGFVPTESKGMTRLEHSKMTFALKHAEALFVEPIGRGVHRPYKIRLKTTAKQGLIDCSEVVLKTVHCQYETKRYCQSVDLRITGPERELLAYDLDLAMGFDLVPPTVGRFVEQLGFGSVQAWVRTPLAVDMVKSGEYDYKKHPENPWLHRIAAFDFITGELDRHAANFLIDRERRVYAIDNGYKFPRLGDRRYMKCNVGKRLIGVPVHPEVVDIVRRIDDEEVWKVLRNRGFTCGEEEGVMKRLEEMRRLTVWGVMGGLWKPDK